MGKFILVASSIQAVFFLWRPPSKCFRNLAIVQLALMSATVLEPKPSFASWQMSLPIGSLFVSYLLYVLWEKRTFTATITAVAILVALWLYPGRGLAKNVRLGRHPERWLMAQVDASNALGRALGMEKGVFEPLNHPVVVRDASYYWTQFPFLRRALAEAGITTPPLRLVQECLREPPAVLNREALEVTAQSNDERRAIAELLKAQYSATASGYFVRNDQHKRLDPVLLPCLP